MQKKIKIHQRYLIIKDLDPTIKYLCIRFLNAFSGACHTCSVGAYKEKGDCNACPERNLEVLM